MERLPIAKLNPELSALESKQIKAIVTLIWPFSSSQRHFALLLAEPDFRLRRKKGQVRVRFSGSGARAIATTGVGIGDEVVLSLQGARFIQEGVFSTPGKSLDWELSYDQTVVAQVFRAGTEIANLELLNVAPTPAPRSPVRRQPVAQSPLHQWSSPAFLKRARLSDGPFFEQPAYDPLGDDEGGDKKRRRRSYRDWKAWTYTDRTPSPGKEDVDMDEDLEAVELSPSRPPQLPKTPISPLRRHASPSVESISSGSEEEAESEDGDESEDENQSDDEAQQSEIGHSEDVEGDTVAYTNVEGDTVADVNVEGDTVADENIEGDTVANTEDFETLEKRIRNPEHYQQYDGISDLPSAHAQHDLERENELNMEDGASAESKVESADASGVDSEDEQDEEEEDEGEEPEIVEIQSVSDVSEHLASRSSSVQQEDSMVGVEAEEAASAPAIIDVNSQPEGVPQITEFSTTIDETPLIVMPPPTLPSLRTEFSAPAVSGTLTPIGKEPTSPHLKPQDSSTLPMPSPFPGEHTNTAISYFDDASAPLDAQAEEEDELPSEASYIMENSFYSSISSSKAGTSRPDHESAFTPVRFTFGMDGAGFSRPHDSRPLDLSSPSPEERPASASGEPHKRLGDQDATESDAEEQSEDQEDEEVTGTDADRVSFEKREDQEASTTLDEVAMPGIVASSASKPDTGDADNIAEADNSAISNSMHDEAVRGDESHGVEAEQASPGERPASVPGSVATEHQDIQDQDRHSPIIESETASVREAVDLGSSTTDNRDTQAQDNHFSTTAPPSALVPEVIDLASPVKTANSKELATVASQLASPERPDAEESQHEGPTHSTDEEIPNGSLNRESIAPHDSHSEFLATEFAPDHHVTADVSQQTTTHDSSQQANDVSLGTGMEYTSITMDENDPFLSMDDSGTWIPQIGFDDDMPDFTQDDFNMHHYPDVKMESIEDVSMFPASREGSQAGERHSSPSPNEILIEIPEDNHHKLGESRFVSVPDTGPARNTRSKTKTSMSPSKEPVSVSKRTTRSTRSKASASTDARTSLSPSMRRGSVVSIPDDNMPISPYNLRSQSRLTSSPVSTQKSRPAATRQSPRKQPALRNVDSFSDVSATQQSFDHGFAASYQPSQELGFFSQGRFSNVGYVEDSEESLRSEDSLSTVQYSDGVQPFMDDIDDPPEHISRYMKSSQMQVPSPSRQSRSPSVQREPSTPRSVRTAGREVRTISSEPQTIDAEMAEVASPTPPREIEHAQPSSFAEQTHVSKTEAQQSAALDRSKPLTPDATQHKGMDTQPSLAVEQVDEGLPTPGLTQATSAGLRSFREEVDTENASQEPLTNSQLIDKATPRRNVTETDVASSPHLVHSSDASASDEEEPPVTAPTLPSIGLSTPLAYYTPLKDLVYFLNRSSQFHSSSNPDILAVVTSDSTPALKATKGQRDWTTTLHVADLSTYPAITTVQVFRAYQNALPVAQKGDVVLLRAFGVRSLRRKPMLISADESSWCVWRFGKPIWGAKRGAWGELRAREEVKGPEVERGEGEWTEVDRLRKWFGSIEEGEGQKADEETNDEV